MRVPLSWLRELAPTDLEPEDLRALTLEDQTQAQYNEALYHHALAVAALERITAGGFVPQYRQAAQHP